MMVSLTFDQLNNLGKKVDSEVKAIKTRRDRKKKTDTKTLQTINEGDTNDIIEKRDRLLAYVLSSNSKQYSGKNTLNSKLMKWTVIH